ncbi:MAG: ABC transporter permease, partial [Acidobacteria bacterium]
MRRFLLSRILQALVTLWLLTMVAFVMTRLTGDPLDVLLDARATEDDRKAMASVLGLDRPLPVQYAIYLGHAVLGNFGDSFKTRRPALTMVMERLPLTLELGTTAFLVSLVIAVPIGVISAVRRDTSVDVLGKVIALLGQSFPTFWLGLMLILLFAVTLEWLPASGAGGPAHLVLPSITLGWFTVAGIMRLVRSAMLDTLGQEYVVTARAKGLRESGVVWKHALRNALIPPLTYAGLIFVGLLAGAVVTETVYAWPGVGQLVIESVAFRDFPVIQVILLLFGVMYVGMNLVIDLLYIWIDPRIGLAETTVR